MLLGPPVYVRPERHGLAPANGVMECLTHLLELEAVVPVKVKQNCIGCSRQLL